MPVALAPAKINLFLRIVARRDDGYHDIETLFQRIDLADRLTIEPGGTGRIELTCSGRPIDGNHPSDPEKNLVTRACRAIESRTGRVLPGLRIELEKRIPSGAGLGGGSSDAAATLLALNDSLDLGLSDVALHELAARLGSDVPCFLSAPTAIGTGRGEILTPVRHSSRFIAALAMPPLRVSTPAVFSRFRPDAPRERCDLQALIDALRCGDLAATLAALHNDMESLAGLVEPSLPHLRQELERIAGQQVRMSGSGSTFFTLAESVDKAAWIGAKWRETGAVDSAVAAFLTE